MIKGAKVSGLLLAHARGLGSHCFLACFASVRIAELNMAARGENTRRVQKTSSSRRSSRPAPSVSASLQRRGLCTWTTFSRYEGHPAVMAWCSLIPLHQLSAHCSEGTRYIFSMFLFNQVQQAYVKRWSVYNIPRSESCVNGSNGSCWSTSIAGRRAGAPPFFRPRVSRSSATLLLLFPVRVIPDSRRV